VGRFVGTGVNRNWPRVVTVAGVPAVATVAAGVVLGGAAGAVLALALVASVPMLALFLADRVVLSALRARPVGEVEYPQLFRLVRELSKAARLPVPRIYVSPARQPSSFAIGRSRRAARVCCTEGLLQLLTADELRGVLGHELAHVRERDTAATSFCAGLAAAITSLARPAWLAPPGTRLNFLGAAADPGPAGRRANRLAMPVVGPVAAALLQLSLSRGREYRADAVGATLAGDPLALARALRKIEARTVELPLALTGPHVSASPLMIVDPFTGEGLTRLFATHPPTTERVFRLEALAGYPR
jgi:heat shock protein HtpX